MDADELYGLPLDRFIPERAALAKALRADKRRDEAAAVAALRKPSVAAWAVNQVVRSQGAGVQELFAAGDELRDAQAQLLAGSGDGRALRAASQRERDAVDELVRAARGLLSSEGHELSPAVVERVADTLHAAALDPDAREQVREGRLERELRHVGLGLGEAADPFAVAPAAPPAPRKRPAEAPGPKRGAGTQSAAPAAKKPAAPKPGTPSADERRAAREQAKREREERERLERERTEARKAARIAEAAARRRAERAGHALKAAEERRERAARALEQAEEALAAAQAEVQDALAEQERAQAELDAL